MLRNIIGIGGEPGSGKSTLVYNAIKSIDPSIGQQFSWGVVKGHYITPAKLIVLGLYDGSKFQGTDRLSMSVQPKALSYMERISGSESYSGWSLMFEGDRLFGIKFLSSIKSLADCRFFLLNVTQENLSKRRAGRGSNQNETWLKGRKSKLAKIKNSIPVEERANNSAEESSALLSEIISLIKY